MHILNWKPDLPDIRDQMYFAPLSAAPMPVSYSQRSKWPQPYDQGDLGSCTANSLAGILSFQLICQKKITDLNIPKSTPSRLFIYYNERVIEGTVNTDSGAYIRDGIKSLCKQGACFEDIWPYITSKFAKKPTKAAYIAALKNIIKQYERVAVSDINSKKIALTTNHGISFGISVYESFESKNAAKTGLIPMPKPTEKMFVGHAMTIIGYDDTKIIGTSTGAFEVRNSWGTTWGDNGHCWIPYDYLNNTQLCADNWIVKLV